MTHARWLATSYTYALGCRLVLDDNGAGRVEVGPAFWHTRAPDEQPYALEGAHEIWCTLYPRWWQFWRIPVHEAVARGLIRYTALTKDAALAKRVADEMAKVADDIANTVKIHTKENAA